MTWTVQGGGGEPVEFHMPAWGWPLILVDAIILIPISLLVSIIIAVSAALRVHVKLVSTNTNTGPVYPALHLPRLHHH